MIKTLTLEESERLLELVAKQSPRNYTMIKTLLNTGLRVSELTNLVIDDVWISGQIKRILIVRKEISKNSTQREVPLSPSLQRTLLDYLAWVETHFHQIDHTWCLFLQYDKPSGITPRQVERIIRTAGRDALGRRIWPHMLRHTFASNLLKVSNTVIVQQILGHKNLSSTQIYVHPSADDRTEAISRLENNHPTR